MTRDRHPAAWARIYLLVALLAGAQPILAADEGRTRGVRLLDPGEEMMPIAPFPEVTPGFLGRTPPNLEMVRVAVAEGPASRLDGLGPRAAPFEIVPLGTDPDLVWNASTGDASAGGQIIAYGVERDDLPAVIDRMAAARALAKEAAAKTQPIKLVSGRQASRKGEKIEIEVADVAQRALILFGIAGDGTVQTLYPLGGDARRVHGDTFRWAFQVREPYGTDLIVAVSSGDSMDALEQGLKEINRHRSAGEIPKLLALAAPADAKFGMITLSSLP